MNNHTTTKPPPPPVPPPSVPSSSDMNPLSSEMEDPVTPKTIHMSNNNNNMILAAGIGTTTTNNNNVNGQPPPAPPSLSLQATSDDSSSMTPSSYLQRSIPVHKRNHYFNHNNNNNTNMSYHHGYSITSSTRSVKSVGSSIIDTEDEDKSQTGISFMSQDYNMDEKSVLSREIPRIVPKGVGTIRGGSTRIGIVTTGDSNNIATGDDEDDADLAMDDEDEVECEEDEEDDDNSDVPTSNLTVGIMGKYMKEIQIGMERGLREIKQQNQRDHEKGK